MPNNHIQDTIESLINEAKLAASQLNWETVRDRAQAVLALDHDNREAYDFIGIAAQELDGSANAVDRKTKLSKLDSTWLSSPNPFPAIRSGFIRTQRSFGEIGNKIRTRLNKITSNAYPSVRKINLSNVANWRLAGKSWILEPMMLIGMLAVIFGWVYRDIYHGRPILIGDLTPFFNDSAYAWSRFTNAWSETNLGWENPLLSSMTVIQVVTNFLTGDSASAQRLFYLSLMPLSVVSMYFLLRYLVRSSATRIIIALAYGINGASITWFAVGAFPFFSILITSPLLILFFIKYLKDQNHRVLHLLLFTAILAFETGIQPYVGLRMIPLLIPVWLLEFNQRRSWNFVVSSLVGIGAAVLLYAVLIAPFGVRAVPIVISSITGSSGGVIGLASGRDISDTVETMAAAYATPFVQQTIWYLFYVTSGIVLLSYVVRKSENRWMYVSFALLAIMIVAVMFSIKIGLSLTVFEKLPFLLIFKEPQKLQTIVLQASFLAIALLMDDLSRRRIVFGLKRAVLPLPLVHVWLGLVVLAGGIFFVVTEAHPPFDNEVTNVQRFLTTGFETGNQGTYEVPEGFDDVANWLQSRRSEEGFFRTIWLPGGRYIERNLLPIYDPLSFRKPDDPMLTRLILDPIYRNKGQDLATRLGSLSVKYVIVPDLKWEWVRWQKDTTGPPHYIGANEQGFVSVGDPAEYRDRLSKVENLVLVHSEETFSVFENLRFLPHFTAYTKTLVVAPIESVNSIGVNGSQDSQNRSDEQTDASRPDNPAGTQGQPVDLDVNLLSNGDFDEGSVGWNPIKGTAATYHFETTSGGRSSVRITVPAKPEFGGVIQTIETDKVFGYEVAVEARAENATRASLRVYYLDGAGEVIAFGDSQFRRIWFPLSSETSVQKFLLFPPPKTEFIRLYAEATYGVNSDQPADTWFESVDVRAKQLDEFLDLQEKLLRDLSLGNLLVNGSFEEGTDGWISFGSGETVHEIEATGLGGPSLKVTVPQKPNYGGVLQTVTINDSVYHLAISARADNATRSSFRIIYKDKNGERLKYQGLDSQRIWFPVGPNFNTHQFILEPPTGSRSIQIHVEATYGADDSVPSITWFDLVSLQAVIGRILPPTLNVEFVGDSIEGEPQYSESLGNLPVLVEKLPYTNQASTLILLADHEKAAPEDLAKYADAVVFLGTPNNSVETNVWITEARSIVMIYEAESSLNIAPSALSATEQGEPRVSVMREESLGYGMALSFKGQGLVSMELVAPRSGFYRILLSGDLESPQMFLEGIRSSLLPLSERVGRLQWFESSAMFLEKGRYSLVLSYAGDGAIIDQVVVINTSDAETNAENILNPLSIDMRVTPKDFGTFQLSVKTEGAYTLFFRESYDPDWKAFVNGEELNHSTMGPLGWANGFYSPTGGDQAVTVRFSGQGPRRVAIGLWMFGWVIVSTTIVFLMFPGLARLVVTPLNAAVGHFYRLLPLRRKGTSRGLAEKTTGHFKLYHLIKAVIGSAREIILTIFKFRKLHPNPPPTTKESTKESDR